MKSKVEYYIVRMTDIVRFEEEVQSYIDEGWEPQGGVSVYNDHHFTHFMQAMILRHQHCKS